MASEPLAPPLADTHSAADSHGMALAQREPRESNSATLGSWAASSVSWWHRPWILSGQYFSAGMSLDLVAHSSACIHP